MGIGFLRWSLVEEMLSLYIMEVNFAFIPDACNACVFCRVACLSFRCDVLPAKTARIDYVVDQ